MSSTRTDPTSEPMADSIAAPFPMYRTRRRASLERTDEMMTSNPSARARSPEVVRRVDCSPSSSDDSRLRKGMPDDVILVDVRVVLAECANRSMVLVLVRCASAGHIHSISCSYLRKNYCSQVQRYSIIR